MGVLILEHSGKMQRTPSMQDVLFQVARPSEKTERAEFYDLSVSAEQSDGRVVYVFREKHGWWDSTIQHAVFDQALDLPSEVFPTFHEAVERHSRQKLFHTRCGFIHSFNWHPLTGLPAFYLDVG